MKQQPLFEAQQQLYPLPLPQGIADKSIVILLDLNYTLVSDSHLKRKMRGSYASKVDVENYRRWLVELVRGHTVCLCTVRHTEYEERTLAHIEAETGWKPEHAFFNPLPNVWHGNIVKEPYLLDSIFPMYGIPSERKYLALESGQAARSMYKRQKIHALPVPYDGSQWDKLPFPIEWGI